MASKPAKYHLSLRVDPVTAQRIEALRGTGETQTSAYNRTLAAGVAALENPQDAAQDAKEAESELVKALREHIATLSAQLTVKDEQIKGLGDNLRAAQTLHAADKQPIGIEATEQPNPAQDGPQDAIQAEHTAQAAPRGFFQRLRLVMGR